MPYHSIPCRWPPLKRPFTTSYGPDMGSSRVRWRRFGSMRLDRVRWIRVESGWIGSVQVWVRSGEIRLDDVIAWYYVRSGLVMWYRRSGQVWWPNLKFIMQSNNTFKKKMKRYLNFQGGSVNGSRSRFSRFSSPFQQLRAHILCCTW
jgi:hypothetical protein